MGDFTKETKSLMELTMSVMDLERGHTANREYLAGELRTIAASIDNFTTEDKANAKRTHEAYEARVKAADKTFAEAANDIPDALVNDYSGRTRWA